ncbi:MAG: AAA family ATPase [bacterium]
MSYQDINNVLGKPLRRIETNIEELNWLYGCTPYNGPGGDVWGIPLQKISIWAAAGGVGKSRLAIHLAKSIAIDGAPDIPQKVLYFQNEVDIPTFKGWIGDSRDIPSGMLHVSTDCAVDKQLEVIKQVNPTIVFVDSIQMIYEFSGASDNKVRAIINGYKDREGYRDVAKALDCHIVFLCQLTKQGEPKGSTMVTHLPDQVFLLEKLEGFPDRFVFKVGDKNRCGRVGENFTSWWKHLDNGVECESDFRLEDEKFCKSRNIPMKNIKEEIDMMKNEDMDKKKVEKKSNSILDIFKVIK